jgi:hypothetical protein
VASITLDQSPPIHFGDTVSFTVDAPPPPGKSQLEISVTAFDQATGDQVYLDVHVENQQLQPWTAFKLQSDTWAGAPYNSGPANVAVALFYYTWKGHQETGIVNLAATSFVTE